MKGLYYGDYLHLEKILGAQELESAKHGKPAHEEMLFIIVHQAFELWFKQIMHELGDVVEILGRDYVPEADVMKALARVQRVNRILTMIPEQFSILETMTPREFMEFRDYLYPASGFQSWQFRMFEISLGVPEAKRLQIDVNGYMARLNDADKATVEATLAKPSLADTVERWLEKLPFMETDGYAFWNEYRSAVQNIFDHDRAELDNVDTLTDEERAKQLRQIAALEANFNALFVGEAFEQLRAQGAKRFSQRATLAALFITVYSEKPLLTTPYRLLDALLEMDKLISVFRYRHTVMVSRMIGQRTGTGGSSGFDYLMRTVTQHRVFTDFADLSSYILPSSRIPNLPDVIAKQLHFVAES
ncbi:MAG: tryptophan 2,3-dioxygenase [Candidatus Kapabacteria bacterium]|nr:tryptophan 2,3-dioxygenase [Candidatus Kapabacteria bacterium]